MIPKQVGPIEDFSWGKYVIFGKEHSDSDAGRVGVGKDIRIIGEVVTEWIERKGHLLANAMITGVYDQEIEVLVIGTGVSGALTCPQDVIHEIQSHGIEQVILLKTPDACQAYNRLIHKGKRAALLAHGTC